MTTHRGSAHCLLLVLCALPGVRLAGQKHTATLPKAFTGVFGGTNYYLAVTPPQPLRGQYWYRGDQVPGPSVSAVATRTSPTLNSPSGTWIIELAMTSTPVGFGTLSTTLANNLGPTTTVVFPRQTVSFPAYTPSLGPDTPPVWQPLAAPWMFTGPNLLLDYRYGALTTAGSANINFDALTMMTSAPTVHRVVTTKPCGGGSLAATYVLSVQAVTATGLPANAPATFVFGVENVSQSGIPLPLDLGLFGITGCELGVWPLVNVTVSGTPSGTVGLAIQFTLPVSSLVVLTQVLHPTTANPSGWATTNLVASVLGAAGIMNNLLSFDGITAYQAASTTNSAPVFLVK